MAAEALALRGLVKTFGATWALDGANLVVARGTSHGQALPGISSRATTSISATARCCSLG